MAGEVALVIKIRKSLACSSVDVGLGGKWKYSTEHRVVRSVFYGLRAGKRGNRCTRHVIDKSTTNWTADDHNESTGILLLYEMYMSITQTFQGQPRKLLEGNASHTSLPFGEWTLIRGGRKPGRTSSKLLLCIENSGAKRFV